MPLARISLRQGSSAAHRQAIADGVHRALTETFNVPADDRFQIIDEYPADRLVFDQGYLGIHRSDAFVAIELTVSNTRTLAQKQALYRRIVELLADHPGLDPQDVFINLVEVVKENWSFGNGIAQYA
ncbi:MAG TPA: tautomerase family protein [Stellaceae bacterium]|nr:tautomerase family protein [Stellaceae bacterium]